MKYKTPPKSLLRELRYDKRTGLFWWNKPGLKRRLHLPAGAKRPDGYIVIKFKYKLYYAHRLAFLFVTGSFPQFQIDHKDGDASNTRWKNLRRSTQSQNRANARASSLNTSGFKGVTWSKDKNKWEVRIKQNRKTTFLGYHDDIKKAVVAYQNAAKQMFGEFARV